jgi:phosphate uptake regulator
MARQTLENKNVRKITKSGGKSYSLTLPISFIRELGWQKKQKVVVEMDKKKKVLVIKDWG